MTSLRWILHVDMDAFFASVEQRDHPEYRGKPLIVGGVGRRGVVSTASYEARKFGVHSALPMEVARKRCPQGIFIPCDHGKYERVSAQIMKILADYSPCVEPLSLDEAFLDISGMEYLYASPMDIAREIKNRLRQELELTGSIGIAPNKFLAKMASDLKKPDGLVVIEHGSEREFLNPLPIDKLWGVGAVTAKTLKEKGILTIGALASLDETSLKKIFGQSAGTVFRLVRGEDDRQVETEHQAKSVGAEETYERDLREEDELKAALTELAERVGFRLRQCRIAARTLTLKLRYGTFETLTRQRKIDPPTQADDQICRIAWELLEHNRDRQQGIRLLGITASHLQDEASKEVSLFAENEDKSRRLLSAVDSVRARFGQDVLMHGRIAAAKKKERQDKDHD